ncbi:MAG: pyrimidine 5'-nucleotidase [Caldisericia bacterium]
MNIPILDCDNTLYKSDVLFEVISERIIDFMKVKLGYPDNESVHEVRKSYWKDYGTTLAGLIRHNNVDPSDYLEYIHDLELRDFVKPNPLVRKLLMSIPSKKVIMSNAPRKHVLEVLKILDISDIPDRVYAIEEFNYDGKPFKSSYQYVLKESNIKPEEGIMFDDFEQNLNGAKSVGLKTCLVGKPDSNGFDFQINDISEILNVFM